ncbi:MAG: bifunctional pyr operon transcriptional regulator/uracil phosphoribosyltransferase PyrR [Bernardetiaceae bacterium]
MEARRILFGEDSLQITMSRLAQQLIEDYGDFTGTVLMGLQPRGILFARRIQKRLHALTQRDIPLGALDITFYRDDFRRRDAPLSANATDISFIIEGKRVILIDDVLYTGRTVRSALDAMAAYGRPKEVSLLVLIDRKYSRHLPIEPQYIGRRVNTLDSQRIQVEWSEQGHDKDAIWLIEKN